MPFQKGWGERTDQSESAACPPHPLSHTIDMHSRTEVVTSVSAFFPRPLLSLFDPFAAPSRPLTALNFPRPLEIFYGHFWAKGPWRRPPGNPGGNPHDIDGFLAQCIKKFTKRNEILPFTKLNETKRNFVVFCVSRNKRNFAKQLLCFVFCETKKWCEMETLAQFLSR
jgi:hypothetical protein